MPKPNIGNISTFIPDPLLSDNFVLEFPSLPDGVGGSNQSLMMQCKTATKPGTTIGSAPVNLFGHEIEFATNKTFSHDLAVTYIENRTMDIHILLENWCELIRKTQTQHGAFKKAYQANAHLSVFNQMGEVVYKYIIVNCWPTGVPDTSFDGSSSTILEVSATFKYDYYYNEGNSVGFTA